MSNEEFDKKIALIEKNIKVISAYDKLYEQMQEVGEIIKKGGEE